MHFTTILATSAAVTGALASGAAYYESSPAYYTTGGKVYTSCTEESKPTKPAVYGHATTPVYVAPTKAAVYSAPAPYSAPAEVTYTSYAKITITSCAPYVTNCPAAVYTSTAYSVSTCNEAVPTYSAPASYYVPPSNGTYVPPVYSQPAEYSAPASTTECSETPVAYPTETPTYTATYYTTVCPGAEYCYATTVTSTWCPGATEYVTPTPVPVATYTAAPPPVVYTSVTPSCPGGYNCPSIPVNNQTTTYTPPPSYTGAASANTVSFGVAAVAGLLALFIAA